MQREGLRYWVRADQDVKSIQLEEPMLKRFQRWNP